MTTSRNSGKIGAVAAALGSVVLLATPTRLTTPAPIPDRFTQAVLGTCLLVCGFVLLARSWGRSPWLGLWALAAGVAVYLCVPVGNWFADVRVRNTVTSLSGSLILLGWLGFVVMSHIRRPSRSEA